MCVFPCWFQASVGILVPTQVTRLELVGKLRHDQGYILLNHLMTSTLGLLQDLMRGMVLFEVISKTFIENF